VLAAGCGGHARAKERSPESVVRAWSVAIDSNDNEAAARLFAPNARILQGSLDVRLNSHKLAVAFNESLPCSGRLTRMYQQGDVVTATFVLGPRGGDNPPCTGAGDKAYAAFTVRHGHIVQWQQIFAPPPSANA
jgi:hypothetical protein